MTVCIVASILAVGLLAPPAHYITLLLYQLSSYRLNEFFTAVKRKKLGGFVLPVLLFLLCFCLCAVLYAFVKTELFFLSIFIIIGAAVAVTAVSYKSSKVKLKLTKRFKRFIAVMTGLSFLITPPFVIFYPPLYALAPALGGFVAFLLAHAITSPIEKRRNAEFVAAAKQRLDSADIVKIGITGSYGKTSAKNILNEMLKSGYSVCATPENYNTPLGIALTVNNELLDDDTAFIAEMGARYAGDIAELAEIVKPKYAMITAIGTQHLETFGSTDAILNTKNELVESLDGTGVAVFNGDNVGCETLYGRCKCRRLISGRDEQAVEAWKSGARGKSRFDVYYGDVSYGVNGTEFTLVMEKTRVRIETKLLGEHIPSVIAECALLAFTLGISVEEIKKAANRLKPVAHRLELLYNGGDVIIDDAYNGNESGAVSALGVLSAFAPKTRVLVTPGVVELGERQEEANRKIGEKAAKCCDVMCFVGPNAEALRSGAMGSGFDKERIFCVVALSEAVEIIKSLKGEKAVLFENDLPDNY